MRSQAARIVCVVIILASIQGLNAQNINHTDNFSNWSKLTDNSIKKGKANSAYYRILNCTTIANRKGGDIMHPFGKIEVKALEELSGEKQLTGFINVAGKKNVTNNNNIQIVNDTIQQFFLVSSQEPVFSVELVIDFFQIDNIYLTVFDNDISEVYSAKDDEANRKAKATSEPRSDQEEASKDDMTDKQTKAIFDLIFGSGSSRDLTITDEDKKEARLLLT